MEPLYKITDDFIALLDMDVSEQCMMDTLEAIQGEIKVKAQNIAALVTEWKQDISSIDEQIKRLQGRKKARQNRIDSLLDYLRVNMQKINATKIECYLFSVTLKKPTVAVEIFEPEAIPGEFIKTTHTPMKTEIAAQLKAGNDVPGARLVDGKQGVLIK